ncbi:OmpH family outer membrane protein [Azotosporobacter soli]|uniref:OmpH family outer membrane protein n=1 Tax=Azotosporobacter soli TaxID=3055040 RepID=UPI0031FEBBB1
MKRIGLVVLMVLVMGLLGGCSGAATVGVVDMNKVMTDSPKVKDLQEQLKTKGTALEEGLNKEKASLSPEEFQKRQEQAYGEFVKLQQDVKGQFDTSLNKAMEEVAKDKKLGVILHKGGVATGGVDVTDEVLKKLQ